MSGAATQSEPLEPTGTPADSSPQGAAQWPSLLVRGLQLAGLWAIAVVWLGGVAFVLAAWFGVLTGAVR